MSKRNLSIKVSVLSFILVFLMVSVGYFDPLFTLAKDVSPKKRLITVEAEEMTLSYKEELIWNKQQFEREYAKFTADKAKYLKDFVESFAADHIGPYGLEIDAWVVSFDSEYKLESSEATYSTLFQCVVHGTWSESWYKFQWLLKPMFGLKPDLYDFEYTDK